MLYVKPQSLNLCVLMVACQEEASFCALSFVCVFPGGVSTSGKEFAHQRRTCKRMWVRSLGWEDPLEAGMAPHSSILAWRVPMDRGAWWASPWGCEESDMTKAT